VRQIAELLIGGESVDQAKSVVDRVAPSRGPTEHAAHGLGRVAGLDRRGHLCAKQQAGVDTEEADQRVVEIEAEVHEAVVLEALVQEFEPCDWAQAVVVEVHDIALRNVGRPDEELISVVAEGDIRLACIHDDLFDAVARRTAELESKLIRV